MAQDSKRGLFASVFGSRKKRKTEEELEAELEFHRKLEDRIREVLVVSDPPKLEPAVKCEPEVVVNTTEIEPLTVIAPTPKEPVAEEEYSYLYLSTGTEGVHKPVSSSRYRSPVHSLEPARASQAR